MKIKINYFIIPLLTFAVGALGNWATSIGMPWYRAIKVPDFTPPGSVIGTIWTVIFILAAIAAILFWNAKRTKSFSLIVTIFILNGILNIAWSYLFFVKHQIYIATWEAGVLALSVLALILLIWKIKKTAATLLIPYFLWVSFATYLSYQVFLLQ
jgi:tryptophan-rich sensory protein